MEITQLVAMALVVAVLAVTIKEQAPAFALLVSLAGGVLLFVHILPKLTEVFSTFSELAYDMDVQMQYVPIVLKIIGIAYLAEFGSNVCSDVGEGALASKIEMAGKVLILFVSVPIITALLDMIGTFVPEKRRVIHMKIILAFVLSCWLCVTCGYRTWASEMPQSAIDALDFEQIETTAPGFKTLVKNAATGLSNLTPRYVAEKLINLGFGEISANGALMRNLALVCLLGAVLKTLTASFENKAVGEVGFYVCYLTLAILMFNAFHGIFVLAGDTVRQLKGLMDAMIPLVVSLSLLSGALGAPLLFSPWLIFMTNLAAWLVTDVLMPLLGLGGTLAVINSLTERELLSRLNQLVQDLCGWGIKALCAGFVGVLAFQKISVPLAGVGAVKTAQAFVGAVPVVGGVIGGAWNVVHVWTGMLKSGLALAFIIATASLCAGIVVKLLVLALIFKVTAALIQPICDERMVEGMTQAGNLAGLFSAAVAGVAAMFTISVVVSLSF